jgi:hypothetical protein
MVDRKKALRALPDTVQDLVEQKTTKSTLTLNDLVEHHHLALWADEGLSEKYKEYVDAVYNEDAKEGRMVFDDAEAARMIRTHAVENNDGIVANKNIATLVRALHVVWRRYNIDRNQRRVAFVENDSGSHA